MRRLPQHNVANQVPIGIIDPLEVVEIDGKHRDDLAPPDALLGRDHGLAKHQPVGQVSQRVVARQVAVSDAGASQAQDVRFACSAVQRRQMEDQMRRLAKAELRGQAPMRGLTLSAFSAGAIAWQEEQFALYALDYSNNATGVFSARYRPAPVTPDNPGWVVTVIARQQGDHMVKLYGAVSDPRALGDYPELRLVDAVDPDGYGRYALLFRERKRGGVSWLLARASGYGLQTLFETPER